MTTPTTAVRPGPPAGTDVAAPGLGTLTRVELRKSWDTRAGRWLLLAIGLGTVAAVLLQVLFAETPRTGFADHLALSQLPVGVLLPVLGILLVTSEWSQRTAMTTFTLVPARTRVLTAKVLAAVVLAALGVVATVAVSAVATVLTPLVTAEGTTWAVTGEQLGQVLVVQVVNVLVGVAFGMLLLSSPLAIVLYFVLPTVVTVLVTTVGALDWVRTWLDLTTTTAPMYEGLLAGRGWLQVGASVALWGLLPMVLGWLRIERAEIS